MRSQAQAQHQPTSPHNQQQPQPHSQQPQAPQQHPAQQQQRAMPQTQPPLQQPQPQQVPLQQQVAQFLPRHMNGGAAPEAIAQLPLDSAGRVLPPLQVLYSVTVPRVVFQTARSLMTAQACNCANMVVSATVPVCHAGHSIASAHASWLQLITYDPPCRRRSS